MAQTCSPNLIEASYFAMILILIHAKACILQNLLKYPKYALHILNTPLQIGDVASMAYGFG